MLVSYAIGKQKPTYLFFIFVNFSPNGKLSKDRFVAVYEQFYPGGKAKDFCKYAFSTFDRDNNGTSKINRGIKNLFIFVYIVDFTEFMLAIALTQSGDLDERLALAFDMYDYNNTGTSKLKLMGF
jgi:Ca2+-binding EF-hand superfamily protein